MRFSRYFIWGFVKAIDMFSIIDIESDIFDESEADDLIALRGDWANVGSDIRKGIQRFKQELKSDNGQLFNRI